MPSADNMTLQLEETEAEEPFRKAPLRVGLIVDSFEQVRWIYKCIVDIQSCPHAEISLVVLVNKPKEVRGRKRLRKAINSIGHFSYNMHGIVEDYLSPNSDNASEPVSIGNLIADCPTIRTEPKSQLDSESISDVDLKTIKGYDLDVLIRFGPPVFMRYGTQMAKYGLWAYRFDNKWMSDDEPVGFWEVMEGMPVTESSLQIVIGEREGTGVIYRSFGSTLSSVKKTRNECYWKASAFVTRKLADLYEYGTLEPNTDGALRSTSSIRPGMKNGKPGNLEMLSLLPRLSKRYLFGRVSHHLYYNQWWFGYSFDGISDVPTLAPEKLRYISPPEGHSWADPFPVYKDGRYFVFFEEYTYKNPRGHISAIELNPSGSPGNAFKVLETDYHLSYPFIFEWRDEWYLIPETARNKTVELYKCVRFPDKWTLEKVLIDDVNAVDATLANIGDAWWMFVSVAVDGVATYDELHLFYSDTPIGPWKQHKFNPIKSDVRSARPAGRVFRSNGDVYRPAQDCSIRYGYAISMNKIMRISLDEYQEIESCKILPTWDEGLIGTHTINASHGLTVIDGLVRKRRVF